MSQFKVAAVFLLVGFSLLGCSQAPVVVKKTIPVSVQRPVAATPAPVRVDPLAGERALFERPAVLSENIEFWRRVFSEYSRHQSVIHDSRKPNRIYKVIDFRSTAEMMSAQLSAFKKSSEEEAKQNIAYQLQQTALLMNTPEVMNDEQRQLAALFAENPSEIYEAANNVRAQRGLREQTEEAIRISGQYLPEMERVFASAGLPVSLTRLPYVESSFNINAYSKSAAAGVWQFIPSSAKIYMRLNEIADERKDPWRSTRAASEHLRDDYAELQDWPLAITAYNYGRNGIRRALNEVGGSSLSDLIERFQGKKFGFASRNYYAEFLAANDVDRDSQIYFPGVLRGAPLRFDEVYLPQSTPWSTLVQLSGGDEMLFKKLNPSYNQIVTNGVVSVPAGDTIRVAEGTKNAFESAYAAQNPGLVLNNTNTNYSDQYSTQSQWR